MRLTRTSGRACAFEDHAAAGFVATLEPGHRLDTERAMQVEMVLEDSGRSWGCPSGSRDATRGTR